MRLRNGTPDALSKITRRAVPGDGAVQEISREKETKTMALDMNRKADVRTEAIKADLIELKVQDLKSIVGGFAKIRDIEGESTDSKHKDWIEVLSYSWGVGGSGSR
jgi:hypothetical protein